MLLRAPLTGHPAQPTTRSTVCLVGYSAMAAQTETEVSLVFTHTVYPMFDDHLLQFLLGLPAYSRIVTPRAFTFIQYGDGDGVWYNWANGVWGHPYNPVRFW